nr:MAG TPA: hypothetical protein [Caudoviricetes sp.]
MGPQQHCADHHQRDDEMRQVFRRGVAVSKRNPGAAEQQGGDPKAE